MRVEGLGFGVWGLGVCILLERVLCIMIIERVLCILVELVLCILVERVLCIRIVCSVHRDTIQNVH